MALKRQIRHKPMRKKIACHSIIALFFVTLFMIPGVGRAGGLYSNEFGTPSMGVAGAEVNAVANDASMSFHNPAGMTRIKGKELIGTGGLVYSTVKFDPDADTPIPGRDGGNTGGQGSLLGGFYVHSLNDKWKLGASLISISGAILD